MLRYHKAHSTLWMRNDSSDICQKLQLEMTLSVKKMIILIYVLCRGVEPW
jgi:hypothetical protein